MPPTAFPPFPEFMTASRHARVWECTEDAGDVWSFSCMNTMRVSVVIHGKSTISGSRRVADGALAGG